MTQHYERFLDVPEDYLWIRTANGSTYAVPGDRLREMYDAAAAPEGTTEELLASDPEWLRIYFAHCLGVWPITIPEGGPLPAWGADWLRALGETDEPLSEEEAKALSKLTDPAHAWEIDVGETMEIGPKWLFE